ncbi:MAG TPA: Holliday junction branch migration protein RuvA [Clostridiales bacterium]|nr:Holliday junction branch migration protein RuvA [Clostridiales bacterium]
MFYYLEGKLLLPEMNTAVIDCGGVGYRLTVSGSTRQEISSKVGQTVRLYTVLSVREDAMELYGFSTEEERLAYEQLTSVSGVGPKAAISILSALTVERLNKAVLTGNVKSIATAQGVGNKTAARVILELKDHLAKVLGMKAEDLPDVPDGGQDLGDALNALMVLGYTRAEATAALRKIKTAGKSTEELIKEGLKILSKA